MKKLYLQIFLLVLLVVTHALLPNIALAQSNWSGTPCVADTTAVGQGDVATIQGLQCLVANVLTNAIRLIGLLGFIMFIVASFRYLLSGGNSKGAETARNTFTFAVVGLAVALSAFIILNLIVAFTGVSIIQQFRIPGPTDTVQQ